ncbi:VOC family protein [Elizabethkingia ursingii]|jgi:predicted enzyme related to lactoylglutathione lyase|uniref:Bleomycin resistance protein n=1 Tax=Elizabethkingia ursingii TaxID=1756150 RepID=A0AAJ3NFG2_9FLAO|nr:glyoxalase/bleomycin resistance/extradiol dioxygenase family protein [Elizabethkingia ursingii]MDR2231467.1 VOC family protein [Flavobacteriaceae bacterium]AQX07370.1 bleomycin resistance protein [Elizabethkingia ursingii]KUY31652.1 bleomycin resistance protein [Elizabethkingia ursingii]MCL1665243.1 glyoxalase/bleomycin resistance/extradiol dioxygenase family protein [Elizabethkingia ursingii]OPB80223.1 bleomycin resistance protein [Elizabethkingia ursingii]
MQRLQKISSETNIITWFEIPVNNTQRAKKFYETILDIEMTSQFIAETNETLTFFPYDPEVIQATSGRVTGVLTESENSSPSANGTVVYINASPNLQSVLDKVQPAGGELISPVINIKAGLIAFILDSEGNKIGLHSEI